MAARWFLRDRPGNPVAWIEDGFADETVTWATARGNVRLVDTAPMDGEFLRSPHPDPEQTARTFLEGWGINPLL